MKESPVRRRSCWRSLVGMCWKRRLEGIKVSLRRLPSSRRPSKLREPASNIEHGGEHDNDIQATRLRHIDLHPADVVLEVAGRRVKASLESPEATESRKR